MAATQSRTIGVIWGERLQRVWPLQVPAQTKTWERSGILYCTSRNNHSAGRLGLG